MPLRVTLIQGGGTGLDQVPAVQAILRTIRESEGLAENDAFALESKLGMAVFASDDAKEGPRAFTEKRKPDFQGR